MAPEFATALPRPALTDHVGRLWGVRSVGPPEERSEAAIPGTALILALEHDWWVAPADGAPLRRTGSFAGGVSLGPAVSRHEGRTHTMQVDLSPLGTAAVLGVPGAALAGAIVDLPDLIGEAAARELLERLADADGWPDRFALLEAWIARRVADAPAPRADVAWAVRRLEETGGRLPIEELRRELRCSRRHLSSRFREAVGVGPKAYARLVRFDRARQLLGVRTNDLASVAAACGYSDQAHLTREVRAFAGVTPAALRAGATASPPVPA
ncbi:AraC family transcriptional regulator [Patulibacter sp.]|uniref:helix-turn-helix domain-containing protein n=1 Tax=Patulibacter sp. TaxID=1912859 RepID=UPI00271DF585|nr:AraC family transcriptional regulator [Patulibacter sp.]MDO9407318.1 AraC family transcriptional regulator [Patulibacter sp.]